MFGAQLMMVLAMIEEALDQNRKRPFVTVGIGGQGGAGKSTLARSIAEARLDVQIVATDSFWDGAQFDLPRLRNQVLDVLLMGQSAVYDEWDWHAKQCNQARRVEPTGVVIIEGVCALHTMFRDDLDVRIWVDAPPAIRLERGVARDGEAMRATWTQVWMPSEDAYVARDNPVAVAQFVVNGSGA